MKNTLVSIAIPVKKIGNDYFIWMQKRIENGPLNGFWEFPGGKIEEGENSQQAIARELKEEVNLDISVEQLKLFKIYRHEYPDRCVSLFVHFFNFTYLAKPDDLEQKNWFKLPFDSDIEKLIQTTLEANHEMIKDFAQYLKELVNAQLDEYLWKA